MPAILDAFSSGRGRRDDEHDGSHDFRQSEKPKRDPKKFFLVLGLGILSWVATYVGMLELIEANMGDLPLIHKMIIGFSVAMLMTMIVWLLDQIFAPVGFITRLLYVGGYAVPVCDFDRLRIRFLLESAGKSLRSLALG